MRSQRSLEARQKVLAAAVEVLLETGVNGFTVDEVARRSGVAKTTIYRHFDSGQQLMVEGLDSYVAPFPTPNTGTLRGDLTCFCKSTDSVHDEPIRRLFLELIAAAQSDPELARVKRAMFAERFGPVRTMIELSKARGEIPADTDPDFAAQLIQAPFMAHMMHYSDPPTEDEITLMVDFAARGLGA